MSNLSLKKKGLTQECGTVSGGSNPPLAAKTTTQQTIIYQNHDKIKKINLDNC